MYMLLFMLLFGSTTYNMPIHFDNIQSAKGQLMVAIYNRSEGFLSEDKAIFKKNYPIKEKGVFALEIPNLAEGNYAISCFHDVNSNGTLDKNIFGIPTEPYGFSQGARPKLRAPNWDEVKTYFKGQKLEVRLDSW